MSVLTKVFVVLLTVLSIALSMFVIAAFAQQQNWKASAIDWKNAALAAQAKERAVTANAAIEQQRALDRHRQDTFTSSEQKEQLKQKDQEISGLTKTASELQNKLTIEQSQVTGMTHLSDLLQSSFNREQELTAKLSRRNSELERRNVDLNDRVKELTANVAMARSRVRALKEQIVSLTVAGPGGRVAQIPGGPGIVQAFTPSVTAPTTLSAMTSPIRGEVTDVRGELASISVGSADGVAHGMKFLLYRSSFDGGKPQYLGTLQITRVEANQAAGMIQQAEGEIRPGDLARDEASFAFSG